MASSGDVQRESFSFALQCGQSVIGQFSSRLLQIGGSRGAKTVIRKIRYGARANIARQTLARMQPGSFLVNTARSGAVDVLAVLDAVTSGQLRGAAIDVLETEPPSDDHPLIAAWRDPNHPAHDRIILNPHSAFYSEEGLLDMRIKGSQNCRRVLLGQKPYNVVN